MKINQMVGCTTFFVSPCSIEFLGQKLPGWRLRFIKMIDVGTLFFPPVHPVFFSCRRETCRLWWAWYWWWSWAIKRLNSSKVHQSPQVRLDFSSNSPRLSTLSAFKTFMIDDPLFLMSLFGRSENLEISTPVKCKKFNFDKNSFLKVMNINIEQKCNFFFQMW